MCMNLTKRHQCFVPKCNQSNQDMALQDKKCRAQAFFTLCPEKGTFSVLAGDIKGYTSGLDTTVSNDMG